MYYSILVLLYTVCVGGRRFEESSETVETVTEERLLQDSRSFKASDRNLLHMRWSKRTHLSCRTASKAEVNKAYRKLAQQWHPDAYDGEDKAKAEKMFYDIAAAKEVLTDPGWFVGCLVVPLFPPPSQS